MKPSAEEVRLELDRILQADVLSPQERSLLRHIVARTLANDLGRLYQKALATDLGIASAKQIGVIATRLRTKLAEFPARADGPEGVRIDLPQRGYEARFSFRASAFTLGSDALLLVANAKAAIDQRTLPGAGSALGFLDDALRHHPRHSLLLALKAYCHATRALYGTYPRRDLETAEAIVKETQSAGVRPWESWFADACVRMALHWDWPAADAAFQQAIALSGGDAKYQPWYTAFLASQGRAADAVLLLLTAVARSHDSPIVRADLAAIQIYAGELDDAETTIETAFRLFGARAHYLLYVHKAILQEARGDPAGALATIETVPLAWPRTAITLGLRALFSGLTGNRSAARRHLAKLRAARAVARRYVPAGQLFIAALGAGDVKAANAWLREGALVERDPNLVLANVYPFLRHLHGDFDFRSFVTGTMGLSLPPALTPRTERAIS
jgi:Tfp pilus assembly protein PilF